MFLSSRDPFLFLGLPPYFLDLSVVPRFKFWSFIAWPSSLVLELSDISRLKGSSFIASPSSLVLGTD